MVGRKTSLNTFRKINITPITFSDHKDLILEINYKNNTETFANV